MLFRPLSLLGIEKEQIAITISSSFWFLKFLKLKFSEISRLNKTAAIDFPTGSGRSSAAEKSKILLPVLHEAFQTARERADLLEARGVPEYLRSHTEFPKKISIYDACALTVCTAFFAVQIIIF